MNRNFAILSLIIYPFVFTSCKSAKYAYISTVEEKRQLFEYDKTANIDVTIHSKKDSLNFTIFDLEYLSVNNIMVSAILIVPKSEIKIPAVIFLHGGGQNKYTFYNNAIELANTGIASLLIDAPPARTGNNMIKYNNYSNPDKELAAYIQTVTDVRRGIDFLNQLNETDSSKIAFVGLSKGAWTGAQLAGIETRIKTYILMALSACQTCDLKESDEVYIAKVRRELSPLQLENYVEQMKILDPCNYLPCSAGSSYFFQFAKNDPYVRPSMKRLSYSSACKPKKQKKYSTSHAGLTLHPRAKLDRNLWLLNQFSKD